MKRFFLFIFILISCCSTFAQSVDKDETDMNGNRTIITDEDEFDEDNTIGLKYTILASSKNDTIISICFTIEDWGNMEKGRKLLLKFQDNSIMELTNSVDEFRHPLAGHLSMFGPAMGIQPQFIVTKQQLDDIISKKVVKLRFEQADDTIDIKVKKNKVSKILSECLSSIQKISGKEKNLYEGF